MKLDFRWLIGKDGTKVLQWRYLMRHSMGIDYWSEWQEVREENE